MTEDEWGVFVADERRKAVLSRCALIDKADRPARYRSSELEMDFKSDVAQSGLGSDAAYADVCEHHQCIGEIISDTLPAHFIRVMSVRSWTRAASGDDTASTAVAKDVAKPAPVDEWKPATALAENGYWKPGPPSKVPGKPQAVFCNFHPDDPDPASSARREPNPRLLQEAARHIGTKGSLADALVWLTARRDPGKNVPMVVVSYARSHVGDCYYPVPPDSCGFALFRPVPPGINEPYGRTFPEGTPEHEHLSPGNGVPEAVHENRLVPMTEVWCIGVGNTATWPI